LNKRQRDGLRNLDYLLLGHTYEAKIRDDHPFVDRFAHIIATHRRDLVQLWNLQSAMATSLADCMCGEFDGISFYQQSESEVTRYFLRESEMNPKHAIRLKEAGGFQFARINHGKS
jgi:hypothetical protein